MLDKTTERAEPYLGPLDVPDEHGSPLEEETGPVHSLADDVSALFDDGKTYVEAELAYQKSRAAFVADRTKGVVAYGLGAFALLHLALIAATVGVVLALIPLIGAWAATLVVTLALLLGGYLLFRLVRSRITQIEAAFSEDPR